MDVRPLVVALCAVSTTLATPALACAPFHYIPTTAEARVFKVGKWRSIHIEAFEAWMRIEYASPDSPSGRVAVVGRVDEDTVLWFPITTQGEPVSGAQSLKTSWRSTLSTLGLEPNFLKRYDAPWAPNIKWGQLTCRPVGSGHRPQGVVRDMYDQSVCVQVVKSEEFRVGIPLYMTNRMARRIFEVTKLSNAPVPEARFRAPKTEFTKSVGCGA